MVLKKIMTEKGNYILARNFVNYIKKLMLSFNHIDSGSLDGWKKKAGMVGNFANHKISWNRKMHLNKQNISSKLNEVKGLIKSWRTFSNKQPSNGIFKYQLLEK